ncbi:MAG: ABC transporter ATP-binding protein [Armatimonadota bacterium]|nr:ABC transporter ATP-binding protein [Armatimonadota bacterium]MDR7426146.1 ABC transporter ATP-binding protein [Armatimonadota bacterium]MDR7465177.1 ABC transporter ATP-binding protein [Armatimonadota bacterium]MDR7470394.1 ABC transporter ATP-binding protein [Armatimonadota bacterium]MDR7474060.1 ABC transporter ATP-binding protein [Armatimonadota bacterium]
MLRIEGITVAYGQVAALRDASLLVSPGEIVSIIGANGAGKTTLLRTISGLLHPLSGTIHFQTTRIDRMEPHQIARLGIAHVPEGRRIFPYLSVQENLWMGGLQIRERTQIEARLEEVFDLFPVLAQRRRQAGGTLSGGEQQMLAIARALMADPRLLLLDEPSLGLGPKVVDAVFDVIAKLHQQRRTVLLVEQNAYLSLEVADRAYVLETGRIVLEGRAAELMDHPHVRRAYLGR